MNLYDINAGNVLVPMLLYIGLAVLISGHAIGASFTLYLHRCITHGSVQFKPWLSAAMRLCIRFHAGVNLTDWVMVHLFHHSTSDTPEDVHSPTTAGVFCAPAELKAPKPRWPLWHICLNGWGLFWTNLKQYSAAVKRSDVIESCRERARAKLGSHATNQQFWLGPFVLLPILHSALSSGVFYLSGHSPWWGVLTGPVTMALLLLWTIYGQAYVNSYGHSAPARSERTHDFSRDLRGSWIRNLVLNLLVVGEQIHHGHHSNQRSWKFGLNDMGAVYIRLFCWLGQARIT